MQWIFMLVGLALGAAVGGEVVDAVLGGLVGMVLGQAISLIRLQQRNATLQQKLSEFAERFDHGTEALYQRLVALEKRAPEGVSLAEASAPVEAAPPTSSETASPVDTAADELVWSLEIPEPEPLVAAPAQPVAPVDAWALEPQVSEAPVIAARERMPEPAPEPVEPAGPDLFERAFAAARGWLFGGNTVLRIGVLLLFLGLAFLLRYASDRVVVPIELRYAGVALAAVALLALGWWLRHRRATYALLLQGTGIGVLYLTIFAAMRLHPLLSAGQALGLLVAITVFSAMLAVLQDALGLAAAAALGGFAAPILTSTGAGSHVALFSYFALLNAGIFAIAWFKAWRLLNLIGFLGTFGIGFAWGLRSYQPELFASTEPFLLLFFLMYVGIGLLFARQRLLQASGAPEGRDALLWWSARQTDYVDGSVLFGAPLVGFGLQYALIRHIEFGPAFSALALGLFYLLLARVLAGRTAGRALLLVETCLALGVVFGSLAIPLGLDARWTSAAWAVEGAGIFWLGLRQERRLARAFALLLQTGAALAYLGSLRAGTTTLLDAAPLGALMLGVALLANFHHLRRYPASHAWAWEARLEPLFAVLGLAFLYLIAPLCFAEQGTAMLWAGAGLLTLLVGLRLRSRTFLFCAFAVQLLGGALFLSRLHGADAGAGVLGSGWMGLLSASLIGLALIVGMLLAARDPLVRDDAALMRGLGVVLLIGLAFINLAVLFVLPWRTASGVWAGSGLLILWLSLYLR
ncbi:MAG: hypothetical protein GAK43_01310 [Stenotrophomonas maltophilia]|nr:MAG: hypothetical protein GAK43_01310 [Stenotrophomonas maltophilia]